MVEHSTADREVPGSNPGVPSIFYFKTFRRLRSVEIQRFSHFVRLETQGDKSGPSASRALRFSSPSLVKRFLFRFVPEGTGGQPMQHLSINSCKHRWSSGRILACHAGDPGSIPGRCRGFFRPLLYFDNTNDMFAS